MRLVTDLPTSKQLVIDKGSMIPACPTMWLRNLEIQIENGFRKDNNIESLSAGFVAFYDGLTLKKILGTDEDYNKT